MAKLLSAGFVVISEDHSEILLGRSHLNDDQRPWTIFKGIVEEGESTQEAAIRELKEESGIDVSQMELHKTIDFEKDYLYRMKHKNVVVYCLFDEDNKIKNLKYVCSTFYGENNTPEIREYKWFTVKNALEAIFPSQAGLIVELINEGSLQCLE